MFNNWFGFSGEIMICIKCIKEMNKESLVFCQKYKVSTCLDCCGKEYINNVKKGIYFHSSINLTGEKQ